MDEIPISKELAAHLALQEGSVEPLADAVVDAVVMALHEDSPRRVTSVPL